LYKKFDRFCARYEKYGIPNLMLFVAVGNMVVFIFDLFAPELNFAGMLAFYLPLVLKGEVWRLFTFVLIPETGLLKFLTPLVIFFYYWLGKTLQSEWGRLKFTIYYLTGMLLQILVCSLTKSFGLGHDLNLTLFLAVATLFPEYPIRLFFVLPIKMKWLALFDAVLIVLSVWTSSSLLPLVPLINYLFYFSPTLIRAVQGASRYPTRNGSRPIQMKKAANAKKKQRGYLHKCHVCGLTDVEDPSMEFRYCSLCSGYECYCSHHIRDHTHVTGGHS
jgi:hypothetical protein